jgi:hypothetical protein
LFLQKPFTSNELLMKVKQALGGRWTQSTRSGVGKSDESQNQRV